MLTTERVVRDAALRVAIVLGELKQAVELKGWLIVWAILWLQSFGPQVKARGQHPVQKSFRR